jgi:hypothetical protein
VFHRRLLLEIGISTPLLFAVSGCCTGSASEGASLSAEGANRRAAERPGERREIGPDSEGLVLSFTQAPSTEDVILNITLVNSAPHKSFWIPANPFIGHGHPVRGFGLHDIEVAIMDARHRSVQWLCSEPLIDGTDASRLRQLRPGDTARFEYRFDGGCYSLVAGEVLMVQVAFLPRDRRTGAEDSRLGVGRPVSSDWQRVVVPQEWKDHY